jgi:hypothetical protein
MLGQWRGVGNAINISVSIAVTIVLSVLSAINNIVTRVSG